MDKSLLSCLCCPACKASLALADSKEDKAGQIIAGAMLCANCRASYEVIDGIPVLWPGPSPKT